ncbi:bifunctional 5,10-methylenetetrahydrofolate dehydrogenase/5,10-methenyltetrahydrofolate cyclohydrolase [Candidatus Microgenomates bacterium]|nr:MAG: bifunctional 5,10-methylenetetrahydrofolate dehydrogenase/5,10-methenyltetrahydrofolate cyclohydrolase [Candidatus Microgenomates bacterium]
MRIDGKEIAAGIFENLKKRVEDLKKKGIIPHFAVILVGEDPASKAYVRQKELKTIEIGAKHTTFRLPETISEEEVLSLVEKLNKDKTVHGIIVQRPLPSQINPDKITKISTPEKDIDSFHPDSFFPMPLAAAVLEILKNVYALIFKKTDEDFLNWLKSKKIIVIGKGATGGGPTAALLKKLGANPQVIDSKTKNPEELTKEADIVISAVGRPNIIKPEMIKKGVILITVGMSKGGDGKLHGDYNEEEIKDITSFYTPVPGGVGPVNVAMLLENLVSSAERLNK